MLDRALASYSYSPPPPPTHPPTPTNPPLLKSRQGPTVRLCRRVSTFYTDAGASEETNKPASNWRTCLRKQRRRQEAHSKSPFPAAFSTNDISNWCSKSGFEIHQYPPSQPPPHTHTHTPLPPTLSPGVWRPTNTRHLAPSQSPTPTLPGSMGRRPTNTRHHPPHTHTISELKEGDVNECLEFDPPPPHTHTHTHPTATLPGSLGTRPTNTHHHPTPPPPESSLHGEFAVTSLTP